MPRFLRPAAEPVEDVNPQPAEQPANVQAIAPENEENQDGFTFASVTTRVVMLNEQAPVPAVLLKL